MEITLHQDLLDMGITTDDVHNMYKASERVMPNRLALDTDEFYVLLLDALNKESDKGRDVVNWRQWLHRS